MEHVGPQNAHISLISAPDTLASDVSTAQDAAALAQKQETFGHSWIESSSSEDESKKMPDGASLCMMSYFSVLMVTNIVVIVPTADQYSAKLGGNESFSGLMIGLTPAFAGIGILLTQMLLRVMTMKSLMFMFSFGSVIGNVLYALGGLTRSPWTLLIARSIIGLCAGTSVPYLYMAAAVGIKKRTQVGFVFQAMATLGYVMGPLLAWALEVFLKELRIENLLLDSDTMPGWSMAVLYFMFMPMLFFLFRDPQIQPSQAQPEEHEYGESGCAALASVGVAICLWAMLILTISTAAGEVFASKNASQNWGWNVEHTSLFLVGVMATVAPMTGLAGRVVRRVQDRKGLIGVCSLVVPICFALFNFHLSTVATTSVFSLGLVGIFAAGSIGRACVSVMMTKIVSPRAKPFVASMGQLAVCAGRGAGSFMGPMFEPTSFAIVQILTFASTGILALVGARFLKTHAKAC